VLQASLENRIQLRRPVEPLPGDGLPRGLGRIVRAAEKIDSILSYDDARDAIRDVAQHRYCQPTGV
jgi:hypothetical protein